MPILNTVIYSIIILTILFIDYYGKYKKEYDANSYLFITMIALTIGISFLLGIINIVSLNAVIVEIILYVSYIVSMLLGLFFLYYIFKNYFFEKQTTNYFCIGLYAAYYIAYLIIITLLFHSHLAIDLSIDYAANKEIFTFNVLAIIIPTFITFILYIIKSINIKKVSTKALVIFLILLISFSLDIIFNSVYTSVMGITMALLIMYITKYDKVIYTDPLTKVYNRRFFDNLSFSNYMSNLKGHYGIFMIDIDDFKNINDKYGHKEGDKVLKIVSSILYKSVRKSDYIVRYGGDEFLVIAKVKDEKDIELIEEKILDNLKSHNSKSKIQISFSVGGELYHSDKSEFHSILQNADNRMYDKKKNKNSK